MTTKLPPSLAFALIVDEAGKIFRSVLGDTTPDEVFKERKLTISDDQQRLYEFSGNDRRLAEAVLGVNFPRIEAPVELEHYTPFSKFRNIIATQNLQLQPVSCYLHQHEFATFAREHDLDGYFTVGMIGKKVFEELTDDLFFLSMSFPSNPNEASLWDAFADSGRGVRLRLRLTPLCSADLRKIGYRSGNPTALKRINDQLQARLNLTYTPWSISRICAFYLPVGYAIEHEARLILKRHQGGEDRTVATDRGRVWPVPLLPEGVLGGDRWCQIELVGVTAGPRCSVGAVQNALAGTPYSGAAHS